MAPDGTLYLEPTTTPGSANWNATALLSYAHRPLVIRDENGTTRSKIVAGQVSFDALASIGIGKRGALGVAIPVVVFQDGQTTDASRRVLDGATVPKRAWGDLALIGKYNLKRMGDLGGLGVSALGRFTLPSGTTTALVGDGGITAEARGLVEYKLVFVSFQGTAGFKLRPTHRDFGGATWGNEIPWGAGLTVRPQALGIDKKARWTWGLETHGYLPAGPSAPFTNQQLTPVYAGGTARYAVKDLSLFGGVELGLSRAAGSAPLRGVLGIDWAPREHDLDHDGVPDDVDECMGLAEDRDGFEDADGCPEMDNDDDGVLDPDDKCPNAKEDEDGFEDEDGCPDPDNDGDGVLDVDDACPNEAGPRSTSRKRNGCPVRDLDGDGVMDDKDKCPKEPEDRDGFEDDDGCPEADNDRDGIPDLEDACPDVAGVAHTTPALHGCPSTDIDGDGIPNDVDKCPAAAETYNGKEDDDGCPEDPKKVKGLPLAAVVERKGVTEIALRGRLAFEGGTDGAPLALAPSSLPLLRAVSSLLAQNPTWKLRVSLKPPGNESGSRTDLVVAKITTLLGRRVAEAGEANKKGDLAGVSLVVVKP